jgi:WD40 repeat protein
VTCYCLPPLVVGGPERHRILSGSLDATARVWDAEGGALLLEMRGHRAEVNGVAACAEPERGAMRVVTTGLDQR